MRFWDSSAVVPLLVMQPGSKETDAWLGEDPVVVLWTLTPVEVTSAVRRLHREGALAERAARDAEARIDVLARAAHVVSDVEAVKASARRLLRTHALRAADSMQLAAALAWCSGSPAGCVVHTFDDRLGRAAEREGFDVVPRPA